LRTSEIYNKAKKFCGNVDQSTVFSYLTDAVIALSAKGEFEVMKAYVDLPVQNSNIVTLPSWVDVPLKVSIGDNPAFSRDRTYEFSINGPGPNATRVNGWEDLGFVPTLVALPSASRLLITGSATAGDHGLKVVVRGLDASNNEINETLVIAAGDAATTQSFTKILEVGKDATANSISLYATANGTAHTTLLSTYQPYETTPNYRQIRLSATGSSVRMLVRRKFFKIYTMDDFIPVQSELGLMLMIKALVSYERTEVQLARAQEEDAVRITTEAQRATTAFIDLAKDTEMDSARAINYNNRDSIIVADIYDDVARIVGPIGRLKIFDKITEGLEALANEAHWDGLTGYVDILTDGNQYVTLPRYVESPIAMNVGGRPANMRNKWFEFHLNGPGSTGCSGIWDNSWDWVGDVVTQNPPQYVVQVVAIPDSNADDGKTVTIYGLDENGKPLGAGAGYTLTVSHTKLLPLVGDQKILRIDRIVRDATANFVRLLGYSTDQTQDVQLGYWYPDETEPRYTRIRIPTWSNWIRMHYRKRTLKVSSIYDQIHLMSKAAVVTMIDSLENLRNKQVDLSNQLNQKAVELLNKEQSSRNPNETFNVTVDEAFASNNLIVI
jgi:hypothetical protein